MKEFKTANVVIRIEPSLYASLQAACDGTEENISRIGRKLLKEWLKKNSRKPLHNA